MAWNDRYSPLDRTIDQLEWLAKQLRADPESGTEFSRDDFTAVLVFIEHLSGDLKPLQDLKVQEQR
jgi:hypothetical protein